MSESATSHSSKGNRYTDLERDEALTLIRAGEGINATARQTGINAATLSRWAADAGIEVAGAEQTAKANEGNRIAWAQRRGTLIDRLGEVVETLLDRIEADDERDPRGCAVAAGIFMDKAQLLSGSATSRHEIMDAQRRREKIDKITDDLAERRALRDGTTG